MSPSGWEISPERALRAAGKERSLGHAVACYKSSSLCMHVCMSVVRVSRNTRKWVSVFGRNSDRTIRLLLFSRTLLSRRLTDHPSGFTSLFVDERGIGWRKRIASSATKLCRSRRGCFRRGCMDDRNDIRIRPANVAISAPISAVTRVTLRDFHSCQKTLRIAR
jgi:hypothetical protein